MADVTSVNTQVTDAVTQTNVKVVAEAPAQALGLLYQTMAHSMSLAMQNSVQAQGGLQQIGNAITSSAVRMILEASGGGMGGGSTPPKT
ncbi:MAG: RebB family R body protein [Magnetospirillum sp. WYHS-4]